ncbi:MAG: polysaccharide deacetylase family protein, partial [Thermoproteota archaeon]|nr:polysaccharide deacetylase family protein [Thermoproteota archaeon]
MIFTDRKHFQATLSSIPLAIILATTVVAGMVIISPSTTSSQFSYSPSDQSLSSPPPASQTSFIKFKTTTPTLQVVDSSSKSASHHHRTHASHPSSTSSTPSKSSPSSGIALATTNGSSNPNSYVNISNNKNKVVIINFDDSFKNQFLYAKPILDKYGFKATFFEVCNFIGSNGKKTWQDILALQKDGMDIESHTMTHPHL